MKKSQVAPQVGSNVAVFVLLLGLFLAIYVLLLPPADREALLYNTTAENNNEQQETSETIILEQSPGILKPSKKDEIIHKIDSINLYSKEEPKVKDLSSSLYLDKSLTSQTKRNFIFNIDDLQNLESASLIFISTESKGNLIIILNNVIVYDSKISGLANVILPKDLLQDTNNIEFSVSSPGLNIFGKNVYRLSSIKIRENYQLTNSRESRDIILNEQENGDAELSFFLYCNIPEQGARLRISFNNEEVKNEIISCTTVGREIKIDRDVIEKGINTLTFQIDKGDYIFNDIELKVKTEFKGAVNYKFALTEDEYDKILSEDKEAILFLEFNNDERKTADISINGKEFSIDTNDIDYERDISRLVREDNNFIRITPLTEFNIDLMRITLK